MSKYTKELLSPIAKESTSIAQVIRKLGLKETGGNYNHIKKRLIDLEIDITHFLGCATNCGKNHKGGPKSHWSEILVYDKNKNRREKAVRLRRSLIESGREYKCEICDLTDTWNKKTLRLEVDHKDSNCLNNIKENLRFICPNCHSQQLHKGNKGLTDVTSDCRAFQNRRKINSNATRIRKTHICKQCLKLTNNPNYCSYECSRKGQKRAEISNEEMFALLEKNDMNYSKTGRELGISDNAVRKRLKKQG